MVQRHVVLALTKRLIKDRWGIKGRAFAFLTTRHSPLAPPFLLVAISFFHLFSIITYYNNNNNKGVFEYSLLYWFFSWFLVFDLLIGQTVKKSVWFLACWFIFAKINCQYLNLSNIFINSFFLASLKAN